MTNKDRELRQLKEQLHRTQQALGSLQHAIRDVVSGLDGIGEAFPQEASRFLPTASDIIEQMASNAYDEIGEPASEWPDLPKSSAAEIELDILLTQWLVKHAAALKCEFWSVENIERIEP